MSQVSKSLASCFGGLAIILGVVIAVVAPITLIITAIMKDLEENNIIMLLIDALLPFVGVVHGLMIWLHLV